LEPLATVFVSLILVVPWKQKENCSLSEDLINISFAVKDASTLRHVVSQTASLPLSVLVPAATPTTPTKNFQISSRRMRVYYLEIDHDHFLAQSFRFHQISSNLSYHSYSVVKELRSVDGTHRFG